LETAGQAVALVAAVEPDAARAADTAAKYAIPVFATVDELLAADLHLDAATVAVPTVHHRAVASALLDAGIDLLVEKPLAASLAEADDLVQRADKGSRILQPGHLERFNPAVLAIQPQLHRPMFFESHRLSIFTPRALDVDVVLDLMIHDLDIVLTFAASPVREVRAVGLPILSPRVDIANVRVEFESGCVANFTASRVSTERVRKLRFFEPRQYVSIDYARQDLLVIKVDEGAATKIPPEIAAALAAAKSDPALLAKLAAAGVTGSDGPAPGLSFAKPPVTPGEPLRLEILSFLDSVRTRQQPKVTAHQGRDALALALEIQTSMATHAQRAGLQDFFNPGA
jgi:predicted dehydrogenase